MEAESCRPFSDKSKPQTQMNILFILLAAFNSESITNSQDAIFEQLLAVYSNH